MLDAGLESPYGESIAEAEAEPDERSPASPRASNAADWFEVRDAALQAHRTQIDPSSSWFAVPVQVQRQVWPTEEFELARSTVLTQVAGDRPVQRLTLGSTRKGSAWQEAR
jgi:mycothiol S-conjugate amidase